MIDPVRTDVLRRLEELSELLPEMRFGQLIANLSYRARGPEVESIWDMEDQELLTAIQQQVADLSYRKPSVA